MGFSRYSNIVCSVQVIALFTFAAVYEKPSAWPVLRPKTLEVVRRVSHRSRKSLLREQYAPVQVGADLVGLTGTNGMALSTAGLEETSTLSSITCKPRPVIS